MFSSGFRESSEREIHIQDCSYDAFKMMVEYIYSGETPHVLRVGSLTDPVHAAELLAMADQYMLEHLKQLCEARLTVGDNAHIYICTHTHRHNDRCSSYIYICSITPLLFLFIYSLTHLHIRIHTHRRK